MDLLPQFVLDPFESIQKQWVLYGDPEMLAFPFVSTPFYFLILLSLVYLFITKIGPAIVAKDPLYYKNFDYRPLMLIFNGFFFGVNGAGMMIAYFCTYYGQDMFDCSITPRTDSLRIKATKHLAYVYLCILLFDFGKYIINIFRGKYVPKGAKLVHIGIWNCICFLTVALWPASFTFVIGIGVMLHRIFYYGYLVMTVTSHELRPKNMFKWKLITKIVHFTAFFGIFIHHSYYLFVNYYQNQNCGNRFVLTLISSYTLIASIGLVFGIKNSIDRHLKQLASDPKTSHTLLSNNQTNSLFFKDFRKIH